MFKSHDQWTDMSEVRQKKLWWNPFLKFKLSHCKQCLAEK